MTGAGPPLSNRRISVLILGEHLENSTKNGPLFPKHRAELIYEDAELVHGKMMTSFGFSNILAKKKRFAIDILQDGGIET